MAGGDAITMDNW